MKNSHLILLVLIFCVHGGSAFCVPAADIDFTNTMTADIINCRFESAIELADSLISVNPHNPLAPVLKLAALGMRDVDLETTVDSTLFLSTYQLAIDKVASYEKANGVSSYTKTMLGFSKAIHSSFFLRKKMYMSALQNGIDAIKNLKAAKELDSTNTDVDFFLGLYDYAKAELRARMWWVLFWYPGGKKEGIQKLSYCSKSACITKNAALLSLADIYTSEHKKSQASACIKQLELSYSDSRFVLWTKAKYYEVNEMYSDAATIYYTLSQSYSEVLKGNYNSLVTKNKAAEMYYKAGEKGKATVLCKSILNDSSSTVKDIKKSTKRLLEKINES